MSIDTDSDHVALTDETQYWYVMTHLEPSLIDKLLQMENAERFKQGLQTLSYVIPFLYMVWADEGRMADVAENNTLRNYLHSFVFIRATEKEICQLVNCDWNQRGRLRLRHYRTRSGCPIRVTQEEMQPLLVFFIEQHQRFTFVPYSEEMAVNDTVYIKRGVFKNYKASVLEVHHTAAGVNLTLGIPMFNSEVVMQLYDYRLSDVEVQGQMEQIFEPQFVKVVEADMFSILRRRVLHRDSDTSHREDMEKLNSYSILHYLKFDDTATHNHFQALMLLCATLRRDRHTMAALIPMLRQKIANPCAPSSDEETFLLAILFFATKDVEYRKAAREYCRTHELQSTSLAAIMPLVKKQHLRSRNS